MIVDTSAIMAILLDEPERERIIRALLASPRCAMSAGNWIELAAVLQRRSGRDPTADLDRLFAEARIEIVPVTREQADIGRAAYREYGRGTGHRADLNFGDCFAYALAKATGAPLLFKGDDFGHTDVLSAT